MSGGDADYAACVWAALADILRDLCGDRLAGLAPDTPLADIAGLDSLRLVEAVALVEERFGVEVDTAGLARLRVAGDIARLVIAACPPQPRLTAPP